jgi:membrane protease subunit (stomatin/prohibitin family)
MAISDFFKGELIEVIEWTDNTRDTLTYRFEDDDKAIKNGAQLIVRESQLAQFVYLGKFGDTFGPGKHSLVSGNIPVLTKLASWKYGFTSPFKADVYFLNVRLFTGNKWGTTHPIMVHDDALGIVRLRAFGTFDFKIVDAKVFLRVVAGSNRDFRLAEFSATMQSRLVSLFADALATARLKLEDLATRYRELGEALLPVVNEIMTTQYGVGVTSFTVQNISVPSEVERAIDKRGAMTEIGNMNDYVKFQMAQGMARARSAGGMATELAVGLSIAASAAAVRRPGIDIWRGRRLGRGASGTAVASGCGQGHWRAGGRRDEDYRVGRAAVEEDRRLLPDHASGVATVHRRVT